MLWFLLGTLSVATAVTACVWMLFSGQTVKIAAPIAPASTPSASVAPLISALTETNLTRSPLSSAQAETWRRNLDQVARQKNAAIPAIRDFLAKNEDVIFDSEADRQTAGCSSLRMALIQILKEAGGPTAQAAALEVLQRTADPAEIATLAEHLERTAPGKYNAPITEAARETLRLAGTPAWDGRDVGPLLEVLAHFAGPAAIPDLERAAGTWFNYVPVILAELPDDAGIPALIQWTSNPNAPLMAGNDTYLRMLAEVSVRHAIALEHLVALASSNRVPSSAWEGMAASISGVRVRLANPFFRSNSSPASGPGSRSFHISTGNQTWVEIPPQLPLTPAEVTARTRVIDVLLGATENPFGQQSLLKAKQSLGTQAASRNP